jgi:hypothetical protein
MSFCLALYDGETYGLFSAYKKVFNISIILIRAPLVSLKYLLSTLRSVENPDEKKPARGIF